LSRQAREHVTVALVGDGGDEVFAGYPRYRGGLLAQRYRRLPAALRRGIAAPRAGRIPVSRSGLQGLRRAREFLTGANLPDAEMYAGWVEYFTPAERQALLGETAPPTSPIAALYRTAPSRDPLDAMQRTDLLSFLPGNLLAYGDAMSMGHALELRLPLLDHRLVEAVGRLAPALRFAEGQKTLLKRLARRLLPSDVLARPKRGFNPPMGVWLQRDLAPLVAAHLRPERLAALGIAWAPVERLCAEHRRGGRDHALKIWALLVLDLWHSEGAAT
jgi:asparagine synthase (glutamine-hydrolysing)